MQHYHYKFRWLPAVAVALTAALFIHLGNWQADKAVSRAAQIDRYNERLLRQPTEVGAVLAAAAQLQDAPVSVRGYFLADEQFFLDNQQENGKPGVHVITPLQIEGSNTRVLVNRGWVAWGANRQVLPAVDVPAGLVIVTGFASIPSTKKFFLMPNRDEPNQRLWSRIDLARYSTLHPQPVQPFVVLQNPGDAHDNLVRNWPQPEDRVAMHKSYSLQWYAMAGALCLFFCIATWRKRELP